MPRRNKKTGISNMEYFNGILCVTGTELINNVMPEGTYNSLTQRNRIKVLRRGCYGNPALIEFASLPIKYRNEIEKINGDVHKAATSQSFATRIKSDPKAIEFYSNYTLSNGDPLPIKNQTQYANEAAILNTLKNIFETSRAERKKLAGTKTNPWKRAVEVVHEMAVTLNFPHSLPGNPLTLQRKYKKYITEGYAGLIHAGFCNDNKRKVSVHIEYLLKSLYTMPNKPFAATVHEMYNLFLRGGISVYDKKTGEMFDPEMFQKNGVPIELSESTIWNYLNNPLNRIIEDESRNDSSYNSRVHRPFHRRKSPNFSFSKISMDDRDLTRKLHSGARVKAYYAYDVTSGCVVGSSYSLTKDETLFLDCMRETFRTIERGGWGMPMEVEVEHHLVNKFFDDLALMFPYLRICIAGNSREKRAEHMNRAKKYGAEKQLGQPVGRWWARHEAYYQSQGKINDQYVEPMGTYESIVADDMAAIKMYNNQPHPKQKKYPGMTRWEVLCYHVNPDLPKLNKAMLSRYVGFKQKTSIRNSKELTVQYAQYSLPTVEMMAKLQPNNREVTAYYIPNSENIIDQIHIYQGDKFICTCLKIEPYNEARAEWTDRDVQGHAQQSSYDTHYRKVVKQGKSQLAKAAIMTNSNKTLLETVNAISMPNASTEDELNIDALIAGFDPLEIKESAFNNL